VPGHINFKWNHSNLDNGRVLGRAAAEQAIAAYEEHEKLKAHAGPHFINENPEIEHPAGWKKVRDKYHQCLKRAAVQDQGKSSSMTDLLSQTSSIFSPDHRS
jgi:hypothetical protein